MSETTTLTPPERELLTPPAAVTVPDKEEAARMVPVTEEQRDRLEQKVQSKGHPRLVMIMPMSSGR